MTNDSFIPVGDLLRQFLSHPMIKASDIKQILQSRGTFSSSSDKKILGPLLIKTGIAPFEFEQLKEVIKDKEQNPKLQTKRLVWDCNHGKTLSQVLVFNCELNNLINDPFQVLSVVNRPQFTMVDSNPNHVRAEVKIKRKDATKNLGDDEVFFECDVEFKVDSSNNLDLNIITKHTSKESLAVTNEIVRRATKVLKNENMIKSEDIQRILFMDFDNINRINFLINLCKSTNAEVYSSKKHTRRIHIQPDDSVKTTRPKEIDFLEKKINDLTLKGDNLDSSMFVRKNELKEHLRLFSVQGSYEIDTVSYKGECDLNFEFPILDSMDTSELTISISKFKLSGKASLKAKKDIKLKVLKTFEERKLQLYNKYKKL
ncbi:GapS4b family protein [Photobacterium damselae]|uniref:GapS4b family protein n=1 Tax=Photobacterium damselae TaxID=38293 RepID=UPI0011D0E8DC|nr:hypothetical protein [Photobacterium damselae]KAB1524067.1 hypothetical protein FD717_000050 [Photobacterium damselae subsp. damselae]MCG3847257.1 hypothetical protein [Photobacterium damselae]